MTMSAYTPDGGGHSMARPDKRLTKVLVELPEGAPYGAESLWAKSLGRGLYEIRNSPWFAFDLHFYDVVRAIADEPDEIPKVVKVVRRSGHKTLRVLFKKRVPLTKRKAML